MSFRSFGGSNLHGWNASATANLTRWFGLTVDFSGHYDSSSSTQEISFLPIPPFSSTVNSGSSIHTFLVGPTFSYRKNERITPFGHILFGASRRHVDSEFSSSAFGRSSFSVNDTAFAGAVGGGLDVALGENLALRVVQADYMLNRAFGSISNNARISTGLVLRFGK